MDKLELTSAFLGVLLGAVLAVGLFIEVLAYTDCHARVEQAGFVPHYDPVTFKCRASVL